VENLDPERFRLKKVADLGALRQAQTSFTVRRGDRFLRGPIPMPWLRRAASQPGKALAVGIEVLHLVGMKKTMRVALNLSRMRDAGVSRWTASRGLAALEKAGLVAVKRHPGRRPVVTVLRLEGGDTTTSSRDQRGEAAQC
jgi:hypothetical protein